METMNFLDVELSKQNHRITMSAQVTTEAGLVAALKQADGPAADKFCFLDVKLAADDVSAELLEFGAELGKFGSRPPRPG